MSGAPERRTADRSEGPIRAPILVVTGPTCGGKTGLAAAVARRTGWPILSLDSMKVYRRMDIGTAKPSAALRSELRFELLDLREPWESFSVTDYIAAFREAVGDGETPRILSGGTAFYLNALCEGIFSGPGSDDAVRERLVTEARSAGLAALHARLAGIDPVAAARIDSTDERRIVRALEVFETTGEPITVWQARRTPVLDPARTWRLGVFRPREELYARIDARVVRMFDDGWVEEVEALRADHDPPWSAGAAQSIGYERIRIALEEGRDPRGEIERIQGRTRVFSRRQLTWVRKMAVEWWRPEERDELLDRIGRWAGEGGRTPPPDEERRARRAEL